MKRVLKQNCIPSSLIFPYAEIFVFDYQLISMNLIFVRVISGFLWMTVLTFLMYSVFKQLSWPILMCQLAPVICSVLIVYFVTKSREAGIGLPFHHQFLSWTLLCKLMTILFN